MRQTFTEPMSHGSAEGDDLASSAPDVLAVPVVAPRALRRDTDAHALCLQAAIADVRLWVEEDEDAIATLQPHRYGLHFAGLKVSRRPGAVRRGGTAAVAHAHPAYEGACRARLTRR